MSCLQQESSIDIDDEAFHGRSSGSAHYQEIRESEELAEQQTSRRDEENGTTSLYEGLDPVAVTERRALPRPVYDALNEARS